MRGFVLNYDAGSGRGLIRGEDGKRYSFLKADWLSEARPTVSDPVDFEPLAELATEIYLFRPLDRPADLARTNGATAAPPKLPEFRLEEPSPMAAETRRSRVTDLWVALFATLSLAATFLPYVSIGFTRLSLLGLGQFVSQLGAAGEFLAPADLAVSGATASFKLLYLLYLIPLLAILPLVAVFLARSPRRLAFWHGLASIVLPIGAPALAAVSLWAQWPRDLPFPRIDANFIEFADIGFWLIVGCGIGQLAGLAVTQRRPPAAA